MKYRVLSFDGDVSWQFDAACLGAVAKTGEDLFFHSDEPGGNASRVKKAKAICATCPVKQKCLRYAVDNDLLGVWGGTTDSERKKLRKKKG